MRGTQRAKIRPIDGSRVCLECGSKLEGKRWGNYCGARCHTARSIRLKTENIAIRMLWEQQPDLIAAVVKEEVAKAKAPLLRELDRIRRIAAEVLVDAHQ